MIRDIEQDEKMQGVKKTRQSMFVDKNTLLPEQLTDPDYRLRYLEKTYGLKNPISCSKCHHCR